jgi:hypothetical protein
MIKKQVAVVDVSAMRCWSCERVAIGKNSKSKGQVSSDAGQEEGG